VKSKVPNSCITIKNKNVNSAFDVKGIRLKCYVENKINKDETEKIDLELNEEVIKKKKVVKKNINKIWLSI